MPSPLRDDLLPSELARFDEVCRFGQDQHEPIARTIAAAFADDPVWQWTHDSSAHVPAETGVVLARMLVARWSEFDEIHGFRHHGAVALWGAPSGQQTEDAATRAQERAAPHVKELVKLLGHRLAVTAELTAALEHNRPEEPHWYLSILATDPDRQNQGLGGRVMQVMLDRCDRLGLPSYLESSNPRNYGFYQRYGYVETAEFGAGDSPPLKGFWREPR